LYELLKSYCGLGGAAASQVALDDNLQLVAARVNLDIRARDHAQVKKIADGLHAARGKALAAAAVSATMANLSRGPSSWIYRLSVLLGQGIAASTPSVAGTATAIKTAGLAVGAVAVPAGQALALGTATLMGWRAIKYGVLGVGAGSMGVARAVRNAVSPGAAALPGPVKYKYPGGVNEPSAAQRARAVQIQARDVLWRYLSAILFGDPERLIQIRDAQGGADRVRTAEQLAEIVRQGLEGVRSSGAAAASAASAAEKRKAAEASQTYQRAEEEAARAFMGKGPVPKGKNYFPQVKPGPGMPAPRVGEGIMGFGGLGRLGVPPGSAPRAPGVSSAELAARTMGASSSYGSVQASLNAARKQAEKAAALMAPPAAKSRRRFTNAAATSGRPSESTAEPAAAPVAAMGEGEGEEEGGLANNENEGGGARRSHRKGRKSRRRGMTKKRGGVCGAWRRAASRRSRKH
jgi:hypothetical protein